jgi:hypothetical protein
MVTQSVELRRSAERTAKRGPVPFTRTSDAKLFSWNALLERLESPATGGLCRKTDIDRPHVKAQWGPQTSASARKIVRIILVEQRNEPRTYMRASARALAIGDSNGVLYT